MLKHVEAGLARAGRPAALLELGGLPPDFPTPVGWPAARYLEVCQLSVGAGRPTTGSTRSRSQSTPSIESG